MQRMGQKGEDGDRGLAGPPGFEGKDGRRGLTGQKGVFGQRGNPVSVRPVQTWGGGGLYVGTHTDLQQRITDNIEITARH